MVAFALVLLVGYQQGRAYPGIKDISSRGYSTDDSTVTAKLSTRKTRTTFAYVTLMAGVNPDDPQGLESPSSFLGYVLHFVAAAYLFDFYGSHQDSKLMLRLSSDYNASKLSQPIAELFEAIGMQVHYLERSLTDDWANMMMGKFQALKFTEYERIIFWDADVLPLCNWEYLFDLSVKDVFAPNVVMAYRNEPAQGGFFLLQPSEGDFEEIQGFFSKTSTMKQFDQKLAFGHAIEPPDHWESILGNGTEWSFYGASVDQGLLYHWVKYVKKDVSLVVKTRVDRWKEKDGRVQRVGRVEDWDVMDCPNINLTPNISRPGHRGYKPFYRDHVHFTGKIKPWRRKVILPDGRVNEIKRKPLGESQDYVELWNLALKEGWLKYKLPSIYTLFPNLDASYEKDTKIIHQFLNNKAW